VTTQQEYRDNTTTRGIKKKTKHFKSKYSRTT